MKSIAFGVNAHRLTEHCQTFQVTFHLPFPNCVVVATTIKLTARLHASLPKAGNKTATIKLSSLPYFIINDIKRITVLDANQPMLRVSLKTK